MTGMDKILKRAIINSLGTAVYIILVVCLIFSMQRFSSTPDKTILIPIAMLLLFVFSAAITGFLVLGNPIMLYIDGKKKEAISLLRYTFLMLALMTLIVFIILINYL